MTRPTLITDEVVIGRLRWRCRRGMLELDLLFVDFVTQQLESLSEGELIALNDLLDLSDQKLWQLVSVSDEGMNDDAKQVLAKLRGDNA